MNLSEKRFEVNKGDRIILDRFVYFEDDVREFIKRLKETIRNEHIDADFIIDKLAGEELTKENKQK